MISSALQVYRKCAMRVLLCSRLEGCLFPFKELAWWFQSVARASKKRTVRTSRLELRGLNFELERLGMTREYPRCFQFYNAYLLIHHYFTVINRWFMSECGFHASLCVNIIEFQKTWKIRGPIVR